MKDLLFHYRCIPCSKMTENEITLVSDLFSNNYGVWANSLHDDRAGKQIKFGKKQIKQSFIDKPDRYVALAYYKDILVGHAFYLKRNIDNKVVVWILQLVVDKTYRNNRIGQKLMYSIWGMSNRWAWGLYTSNPSTIKALEYATMRKINVNMISKHINELKIVASDIFASSDWIDSYNNGIVNTNFPVSHETIPSKIDKYFKGTPFGLPKDLPEGCEWLAFVFNEQPVYATDEKLKTMLEYSDEVIKSAYQGMLMEKHNWAKHQKEEVDYLYARLKAPKTLLDIGCGRGRHVNEFARRGVTAHGIDFVESHITKAKEHAVKNATFAVDDARMIKDKRRFHAIICLYDVIGSFAEEEDNVKILKEAYRHLHFGGRLAISVMNMDVTMQKCIKSKNVVYGIKREIKKLIRLRGSNTMQNNGDIFDGRKIIIDATTGICYRKEEFDSQDDALPIEYIVRDRRYTMEGITKLLNYTGFIVEEVSYVNASNWEKHLNRYNSQAKEILIIAKKGMPFYKFRNRKISIENCWR